jgi:hypothetical protein
MRVIRRTPSGGLARWDRHTGLLARYAPPVRVALVAVTAILFLASAGAFIAPSLPRIGGGAGRDRSTSASAALPTQAVSTRPSPALLTDAERGLVLSYVQTLRPDDPLVPVRPGVEAKRSNVQGVRLGSRTVYYDIVGHQSFGPLASGRVREADVDILSREGTPPFVVLVYTLKHG